MRDGRVVTAQRGKVAFALKAVAYPMAVAAALLLSDGHPVLAVLAFVAAIALVATGSMMGSGFPTTGAHFARFAMEINNELHMVKPPGENVLDLVEGDDQGKFRGR